MAAPDAPDYFRFAVTGQLMRAVLKELPTWPYETLIVFRPWLDNGAAYLQAVGDGVVMPERWFDWFPGCYVDRESLEAAQGLTHATATVTAHDATVRTTSPKGVTR